MTRIEAYQRLRMLDEAEIVLVRPKDSTVAYDIWPALMVAVCEMSGWLDDADDEAGLREAMSHGLMCLSCGVLKYKRVRRIATEVFDEIQETLPWLVTVAVV